MKPSKQRGGASSSAKNAPGCWDFFISHTQRNDGAKLLAAELYASLKELGHSVWFDVKMKDRSAAAMEEGVRKSKCVVAIITKGPGQDDDYFRRDFCLTELRWAVGAEVHIQPVINIDDKKKIGEFMAGAPEDLKHLGGVDFKELYRGNPRMWDVGVLDIVEAAGL